MPEDYSIDELGIKVRVPDGTGWQNARKMALADPRISKLYAQFKVQRSAGEMGLAASSRPSPVTGQPIMQPDLSGAPSFPVAAARSQIAAQKQANANAPWWNKYDPLEGFSTVFGQGAAANNPDIPAALRGEYEKMGVGERMASIPGGFAPNAYPGLGEPGVIPEGPAGDAIRVAIGLMEPGSIALMGAGSIAGAGRAALAARASKAAQMADAYGAGARTLYEAANAAKTVPETERLVAMAERQAELQANAFKEASKYARASKGVLQGERAASLGFGAQGVSSGVEAARRDHPTEATLDFILGGLGLAHGLTAHAEMPTMDSAVQRPPRGLMGPYREPPQTEIGPGPRYMGTAQEWRPQNAQIGEAPPSPMQGPGTTEQAAGTVRPTDTGPTGVSTVPGQVQATGGPEALAEYVKQHLALLRESSNGQRGYRGSTDLRTPTLARMFGVDRQAAASVVESTLRQLDTEEVQRQQSEAQARAARMAEQTGQTPPIESQGEDHPDLVLGSTGRTYTPANNPVEFQYGLAPLDSVQASHTDSFSPNPDYPSALQPRDRTRQASREQVAEIGTNLNPDRLGLSDSTGGGAPIVGGNDLSIESGNGRYLGIRRAMLSEPEGARAYQSWLTSHAQDFGFTPDQVHAAIASGSRPVLVRVRRSFGGKQALTLPERAAFAEEAGASPVAQMSATETATNDARRLLGSGALLPSREGVYPSPTDRGFMERFMAGIPAAERAGMQAPNGGLSEAGAKRVRNAVLAAALPNPSALERALESTDDKTRSIANAILRVAPRLATLRQQIEAGERYPLDITSFLGEAANLTNSLRAQGIPPADFFANTALPGQEVSPEATALTYLFDDHKNSANRISEVLDRYADAVDRLGDPHQTNLAENRRPTKLEALYEARNTERIANEPADLFAGGGQSVVHAEPDRPGEPTEQSAAAITSPAESSATNGPDGGLFEAPGSTEGSTNAPRSDAGQTRRRRRDREAGAIRIPRLSDLFRSSREPAKEPLLDDGDVVDAVFLQDIRAKKAAQDRIEKENNPQGLVRASNAPVADRLLRGANPPPGETPESRLLKPDETPQTRRRRRDTGAATIPGLDRAKAAEGLKELASKFTDIASYLRAAVSKFGRSIREFAKEIWHGLTRQGKEAPTARTPERDTPIERVTTKRGVAGLKGVTKAAKTWHDVWTPFADFQRIVEGVTRDNPEMLKYLITDRRAAAEELHDVGLAWQKRVHNTLAISWRDKEASAWVQKYGEKQVTLDALKAARPSDWQKIVDADGQFRSWYEMVLNRANKERSRLGMPEIKHRPDYYTHFREVGTAWEMAFNTDPYETSLGIGLERRPRSVYNPYSKTRTGKTEVNYDAVASFEAYLGPTLREIYLNEHVQRNRNMAFALAKAQVDLPAFISSLDRQADQLAGLRGGLDKVAVEYLGGKTGAKALALAGFLRAKTGANTIGANIASAFMQTGQLPVIVADVGPIRFAAGLLEEAKSMLAGERSARQLSQTLKLRYERVPGSRETLKSRAVGAAFEPAKIVEETMTSAYWRALYERELAGGATVQQSRTFADKRIRKVMASREIGDVPTAFSSEIGKILFQYQYEPSNFLQMVGRDWKKMFGKDWLYKGAALTAGLYLMNQVYEQATGRTPLPDPIRMSLDMAEEMHSQDPGGLKAAKVLFRPIGELLASSPGGQTIGMIMPDQQRKTLMGRTEVGQYEGGPPLLGFTRDVFAVPASGGKGYAKPLAEVLPPVGGRQALKMAEGMRDLGRGYHATRSGEYAYPVTGFEDAVRAVLMGPNATKAAGEYYHRQR